MKSAASGVFDHYLNRHVTFVFLLNEDTDFLKVVEEMCTRTVLPAHAMAR